LTLSLVISSLTVGTFKPVCNTLFDLYRGAFTVVGRNLFWYLCNISMFELLAILHRGIPYVQNSASWVLFTQCLSCKWLNDTYIPYGTKTGNSNETGFIFQDQRPRRHSPHHTTLISKYRQEAAKNVRLPSPTNCPNCTVWGKTLSVAQRNF
jgi:hypothetical protein